MIIIGERINSTRGDIKKALINNDLNFLMSEAKMQLHCGAEFIDINTAATLEKERDNLLWLTRNIQDKFDCKISIDSPDEEIIKSALKICKVKPIINSISGEDKKLSLLDDLAKEKESYIIALTINNNGMPDNIDDRVSIAEDIISFAASKGMDKNNIFVDPLVKPVSTEPKQAYCFLESIKALKKKGIRCIGGLSNVSFGLPKRDLLNAVFTKLAMDAGIDAAIIDPTQNLVKDLLSGKELPEEVFSLAENALLGRDEYSINYIKAFREGVFNI
jgi:5-methyltetrahydrofolate--homocysteine methyltransferase